MTPMHNELIEASVTAPTSRSLFQNLVKKLKEKINFDDAVFARMNDDNTHSAFMLLVEDETQDNVFFDETVADKFPLEDGIANVAFDSEQPVIFDLETEAKKNPDLTYLSFLLEVGLKTTMVMGLRVGRRMVGLFHLQSRKKNAFTQEDVQSFYEFKNILTIASTNILFRHNVTLQSTDLRLQIELNNDLMKCQNFQELTTILSKHFSCNMNVDFLGLRGHREDGEVEYGLMKRIGSGEDFVDVLPTLLDTFDGKKVVREGHEKAISTATSIFSTNQLNELGQQDLLINRKKELFGIKHLIRYILPKIDVNLYILTLGRTIDFPFNLDDLKTIDKIAYPIALAIDKGSMQDRMTKKTNRLELENQYLNQELKGKKGFSNIIASGGEMKQVFYKVSQVAATGSTVLITGESGTGKELIARAIHDLSPVSERAFIRVNCAVLPENLIESELFGHEKGAFTGAINQKLGKFELAQDGTIFLDEIGELPLNMQAKLLRVLQEKEIERVGGVQTISINCRVLAATNRNLKEEVEKGDFREDLFYRLNVFPIKLPPLRERKEDISALTNFFIKRYAQKFRKPEFEINKLQTQMIESYTWPGNIRELEHFIEQAMIISNDQLVLPPINTLSSKGGSNDQKLIGPNSTIQSLDDLQRQYIREVLEFTKGKIRGENGAAKLLNMKPTTLESRMKKLGIEKKWL